MVSDEADEVRLVDDARTRVHEAIDAAPERARLAAEAAGRRWYRRAVLGAAAVALVVALCIAYVALELSRRAVERVDRQEVAVAALREIADEAKAQGEQANAALERRGQQPVPIPQPGNADDSEVLVAAATARVLAELPDTTPSDAEVAGAILRVVRDNPGLFAPSPQQIGAQVAGYFTANPPPSGPPGPEGEPGATGVPGPQGERGERGPAPTEQEIQAAITALLRDNPDALCPQGGRFAQLRVQLADGAAADTWTCVVQVIAPTTTAEPTEPPLLPPLGR